MNGVQIVKKTCGTNCYCINFMGGFYCGVFVEFSILSEKFSKKHRRSPS